MTAGGLSVTPAFWCVRRCKFVSAQAAAAEEAVLWDLTVKVVDACYSLDALLQMVRVIQHTSSC